MCVRQLWKITLLVVFITLLGPVRQVGAEPPAPQDEADTAAGPSWAEPIVWDGTATLGSPTSMGASHLQVAAAVMSQDFEGAWPAPGWRLVDASSTDGGEYMWGKRTCYPRTGTYGGWSVGGGQQGAALPCSADYPNNARTWAI